MVYHSGKLRPSRLITSASPCTSKETSVPALRLSLWRTALGMAICPFDEMVALVISTYHGKTDSPAAQLENSYAGKTAAGGPCFSLAPVGQGLRSVVEVRTRIQRGVIQERSEENTSEL